MWALTLVSTHLSHGPYREFEVDSCIPGHHILWLHGLQLLMKNLLRKGEEQNSHDSYAVAIVPMLLPLLSPLSTFDERR